MASDAAAAAANDLDAIRAEIEKRHDESVKRLQDWIRQPSIAAENRGMNEGCELTMRMLAKQDSSKRGRSRPTASPASSLRWMPALRVRSAFTTCMT